MPTQKFKASVEYIIHGAHGGPSIGATRLNKTLFYADLYAYLRDGQTITGERYMRLQNGPVPKAIWDTLSELKAGNHLLIREQQQRGLTIEYIPIDPLPVFGAALSDNERNILDDMRTRVMSYTATGISEFSHKAVWDAAEQKEWMPFSAALVDTHGEYSEPITDWAESEVQALETAH